MTRKLSELSAAEVLGLAIDVERSNAHRFATVRDFFSHQDPAVHAVFDALHVEELEHLEMLQGVARELYPDGVPEVLEVDVVEVVEAVDVDDGEHAIFDAITREDALRMALRAERYAHALYAGAAERADDPQLRRVFERLRDLEAGHEQTLAAKLAAIEGPEE